MGFEFQEKHMFEIAGTSYEFDINDIDLVEAIQREFPMIMHSVIEGQQAVQEYVKFFASLGIEDPNAVTAGDLMKALIEKAGEDISALEGAGELSKKIAQCNEASLQKCVSFIEGCLGVEEYRSIFAGQKGRYLDDHVALCKALYDDAMGQRDKLVREEIERLESQKGE